MPPATTRQRIRLATGWGVTKRGNRYEANIGVHNRHMFLGSFPTGEKAAAARVAAARVAAARAVVAPG